MKTLFLAHLALYILGALIPLIMRKQDRFSSAISHLCAAAAGVCGTLCALSVLITQTPLDWVLPGSAVFGNLILSVDRLAAVFLLMISFLSAAASVFAVGYLKEHGTGSARFMGFFYNGFILSMVMVVSSANAFYFLVFWELMSLASYALVVFEHDKKEARRAGLLYFVMTHFGTAFIMVAFLALFLNAGSFLFRDFSGAAASLSPSWKNAIFICALIGFGTKAGMIPLHIWLPEAHPQAPSHVSALMSGVMIKTAVYAFLRFMFDFSGAIPLWWSGIILFLGILSALIGILYALMEHDLKRLLAFSSIENIGIILLGAGAAVFFASSGRMAWAGFALTACLYHALNHAFFKGLLFLGAGSVLSSVHSRDMERLGGLIKKMPVTAASFLVGAIAISALPPLNGFVSEWMTLVSLFAGMQCDGLAIRFFSPILASLLGFAGALAAMCFVKAFGITFLGMPRSPEAENANEADGLMQTGMGVLAFGCVLLALGAGWIIKILGGAAADLLKVGAGPTPPDLGGFSPGPAFAVFCIFLLAIWGWMRFCRRNLAVRTGPSWDCGFSRMTNRMQYSATGYSKPLRRIFSFLYQPLRRVEVEDEGHTLLRTAQRFESKIRPLFEEVLYRPVARWILGLSEKARQIQTGHIQLYLSYIFLTTIILLLFVRLL